MHVTVNGVRLFFDVLGPKLDLSGSHLRERPALICIPGGPGGDHQTLRPYFDRFADVAQVIYLDPRGGGRSDYGLEAKWTLDQWGDDIAGFCDALDLESPVVLGSSGGTLMVQSFLSRHPARAGGAILLNACSRMEQNQLVSGYEELGGPEAGRAARAMYGRPDEEDYIAFYRHCLPLYSRKRDIAALADGARRSVLNPAASAAFFAPNGEAFRFDFRSRLAKVACPVLVLSGAHDPVTPAKWGIEVFQALPKDRSELVIFEESGHLITADEPARFDESVRRFIAAQPAQ